MKLIQHLKEGERCEAFIGWKLWHVFGYNIGDNVGNGWTFTLILRIPKFWKRRTTQEKL